MGNRVWRQKKPSPTHVAVQASTSRPWPSSSSRVATAAGEELFNIGADEGQGAHPRRRRRPRKRSASARDHREIRSEPGPDTANTGHDLVLLAPAAPAPRAYAPCILDWTGQMTRAEDDLLHVVVVSVISDRPMVSGDEIAALIAPWLDVEAASLVLH
jgi:hypothetical protein